MLEDLGNCVKIEDPVYGATIPAVNIQVEGFPKFIDDVWYGIYFEVLFEDGTLWEIEQRHEDLGVKVNVYPNWGRTTNVSDGLDVQIPLLDMDNFNISYHNWHMFLRAYDLKLASLDLLKKLHWELFYQEELAT
jgi:hypothetical protein